ncbi:hypothetical protein M422DRAFT_248931 [Sphaerobolus stellatus SS14]|nr:hypothetical protein M422DRAFT_248931 [Sphaerobolus stellatus SS14]
MPKTKALPAQLHSELTEYASLLRVIRTTATLNVVPQLSSEGVSWNTLNDDEDDDTDDDEEEDERDELASDVVDEDHVKEIEDYLLETPTRGGLADEAKGMKKPLQKRKRNSVNQSSDNMRTQWPLLPEDCPLPEWPFNEEIGTMAERILWAQKRASASSSPVEGEFSNNPEDLDMEVDVPTLSSAHTAGLSLDAANKLSSVLAALADYRPNATWTKHARIAPMDWRDVIEIVATQGIFSEAVVEQVKQQMEHTFTPSDSQVIPRLQARLESEHLFKEAAAEFGGDLSNVAAPAEFYDWHTLNKRKKRKGKKKAEEEEEEEEEEKEEPEEED